MSRSSESDIFARFGIRSWVILLGLLAVLAALVVELIVFRQPPASEENLSEERLLRLAYETRQVIQNAGPYRLRRVFEQLKFRRPLGIALAADGRWFVAERHGKLKVFRGDPEDPEVRTARVLLDLTEEVDYENPEEGFLNVALHPQFTTNGRFFLYYSAVGVRRNVLVEYRLDQHDPERVEPNSRRELLSLPKPLTHHNGGGLLFGPDGMLYLSVGDGGGWGDPFRHGQNIGSLFAKILRIDVDRQERDLPYGIPPDNPFVGIRGARPEIWALGLRNAWRFSFDRETGLLWAGDVGQDRWEEVNIIRRGGNYGWNFFEAFEEFVKIPERLRSAMEFIPPLWAYDHYEGAAVIGGYVYRGERLPVLQGAYIFADYAFGTIRMLRYEDGEVTDQRILVRQPKNITSFVEGPDGELYLLAGSGELFVMEPRQALTSADQAAG